MENLTAKELTALLIQLKACPRARRWAKGKTLAEAWATCENPSWMLWLVDKMYPREAVRLVLRDALEAPGGEMMSAIRKHVRVIPNPQTVKQQLNNYTK